MLELYHARVSTCSVKVRLVLAEKELEWTSREVDLLAGQQHDPDYVLLNPGHVVPTLVDDGKILVESTLINEYLDDAYPDPPLRPAAADQRHAMRAWTKLLDEKIHVAIGVLTYAIGMRPVILAGNPGEFKKRLQQVPEPAKREGLLSIIEHGVESPLIPGAVATVVGLLDRVDEALEHADWLAGEHWSLAEACVLPCVLRVDNLALGSLLSPDRRPRLAEWYDRVRARPSFAEAVTTWVPPEIVELIHSNGELVREQVEAMAGESN
ncbi:MAG: glutathione S-transferase family protein [Proteobacteria bacterium]|nr:glutathione S-transferase family protein [Pseudomonadota bacterium]